VVDHFDESAPVAPKVRRGLRTLRTSAFWTSKHALSSQTRAFLPKICVFSPQKRALDPNPYAFAPSFHAFGTDNRYLSRFTLILVKPSHNEGKNVGFAPCADHFGESEPVAPKVCSGLRTLRTHVKKTSDCTTAGTLPARYDM
jgi:hypothetical protein